LIQNVTYVRYVTLRYLLFITQLHISIVFTYLLHLFYIHTSCTLTIGIVCRPTAIHCTLYTVWSQSTNIKLSSDDEWNHHICWLLLQLWGWFSHTTLRSTWSRWHWSVSIARHP